jgi:hypothetical protein
VLNDGGANAVDVQFTLPTDWAKFWDNVQADLDDVRVTAADGSTELVFDITSLNYNNKAATLRIDGYSWANSAWGTNAGAAVANRLVVGWIYYGNSAASSGQGANVAVSSAKSMNLGLAMPQSGQISNITCRKQKEGQLVPVDTVVKQSGEITRIAWNLSDVVMRRARRHERSKALEEIAWLEVKVEQIDGNNLIDRTSTMTDRAGIKMVNPWTVIQEVKAGSNSTTYLLTLTVGTDDGTGGTRVLEFNANLKIKDLIADIT